MSTHEHHQSELPIPPQASNHYQNLIVPANPYLTEEIPRFLHVYSRARAELDDQLQVSTLIC